MDVTWSWAIGALPLSQRIRLAAPQPIWRGAEGGADLPSAWRSGAAEAICLGPCRSGRACGELKPAWRPALRTSPQCWNLALRWLLRGAPCAIRRPGGCRARQRRGGAVLFEVVLALALLVGAAAVIGGGLTAAIQSVERLRLNAHAMDLAVTVVSELQMGSLSASAGEARSFEPPFEDWTWEVVHQPMEAGPGAEGALTLVEVVIRHKDPPFVYRLTHALPVSPKPASGEAATGSAPTW